MKSCSNSVNTVRNNPKIIVSLTTHSSRIKSVDMCIKSIIMQTKKADKIVLYLDKNTTQNMIPQKLIDLQRYGLEIKTGYENLKPHTKYYYAMKDFPDDIIITVDDDMLYDSTLIEELMNSYQYFPMCVSAKRVHRIVLDSFGKPDKYEKWIGECETINYPSHMLFATGVGGVLYPPHLLLPMTFNLDKINRMCINNDDIWLKYMEIISGVKVVFAPGKNVNPVKILNTQALGLLNNNVSNNGNNVILYAMEEEFNIDWDKMV